MPAVAERSAQVRARTTEAVKRDAASVYAHWGMSLSDAINIFLIKSIEVGGLPFELVSSGRRWKSLRERSYKAHLNEDGVAVLPAEWDDDE